MPEHYTVMQDMDGEDVTELRKRLRELGHIDRLPATSEKMTVEAVKKFQEINKLTVDGKVGSRTRGNALQRGRHRKLPQIRRKER